MKLTGDVETRSLSGTLNAARGISGMISTGAGRKKEDHDVITASCLPDVTNITPDVIIPSEMSTSMSGAPPLTFAAAAGNLTDYAIYGASGGVGEYINPNLFDGEFEQGAVNDTTGELVAWDPPENRIRTKNKIDLTAGTYHLTLTKSASAASYSFIGRGYKYDSQGNYLGNTAVFTSFPADFSVDIACKFLFVVGYLYAHSISDADIQAMTLQKADNGVAIPVTVAGTTTTLLTSAPILPGQKLTQTDTNTNIPTVQGSNTLTVGTTVQPSRVDISYRVI